MTDTHDAVTAFMARGGVVKRVPRTKRTMNEGMMHQAVRGKDPSISPTEERAIWRQHEHRKKVYGGKQ